MIFIWGTKSRQEEGGVVGEWCDTCRAPSFQRLTHYFKVSHVYYIPLGKGQHVGTSRQCTQCGAACACTSAAYARALTHQEACGQSIEQVLQATNPPLLEQVQKQRALEHEMAQRVAQSALPSMDFSSLPLSPLSLPPRQSDQRMLDALQALGTMDARSRDVSQFLNRLQKWDYLTPSEGEVLLHEIHSYITEDRNVKSAFQLIRTLPTPAPKWIGSLIWLAGIFVYVLAFAALPFLQSLVWGSLFLVLTVALCFFAAKRASEKAVRAWVGQTFLPRIQQSNVDAGYLIGLLAAIKESGRGQDEKIAAMTRNSDLIAEELHKRGVLQQKEEPQLAIL